MPSNSFGHYLRITTFGESHGPALGVVLDGLPANLALDLSLVQQELERRRPGRTPLASARREPDSLEVLAGLFEGRTTGAPLCLVIANRDARPADYAAWRDVFRPGHADWTTQQKYGFRDWRGGGRASGRETVARVAAGAVARQLLAPLGVTISGHALEIAGVRAASYQPETIEDNPLRCADPAAVHQMIEAIEAARGDGDSVGGLVEVRAQGIPVGWGDPVFGKLDAALAGALMGIGAVKGVEIGDGFALARQRGSEANDSLTPDGAASNHAGGVLGGISSGEELVLRLAVKPTPSIAMPQATIDSQGLPAVICVQGRHDPCLVPRIVPVAEAMVALVLADAWLARRAHAPGAAGKLA